MWLYHARSLVHSPAPADAPAPTVPTSGPTWASAAVMRIRQGGIYAGAGGVCAPACACHRRPVRQFYATAGLRPSCDAPSISGVKSNFHIETPYKICHINVTINVRWGGSNVWCLNFKPPAPHGR